MIYLESRPSKKVFGEYIFFADIIDRGFDEIGHTLSDIQEKCEFYRLLWQLRGSIREIYVKNKMKRIENF